ncbi:MAG: N-acetylmuramoyl-L-alanine amidase [Anaerolineae bacterium]|nr:N-acetylmuramoyl-L-alanine amidase [Anaerolineae bacterium]
MQKPQTTRRALLRSLFATGMTLFMPVITQCSRKRALESLNTTPYAEEKTEGTNPGTIKEDELNNPAVTYCPRKCTLESLNIIPRAEWKAVEPNLEAAEENGVYDPQTNPAGWLVYTQPLTEVLNTIIVHHSALPLSDGPLEIQYKHMKQKGFADIGYNFIIDEVGQIYEGRNINTRGAHTGGHNTGTVGIVLLGNFEETTPPEIQLVALKTLGQCLKDEFNNITHLAGHRDFQPEVTVCPGKNLETLLPNLSIELGLDFGIEGYISPQLLLNTQ